MSKMRVIGEKFKYKTKQWLPVFMGCMIFSIIIYYMLLSKGLVNSDDGLWEYNYYKAGSWSLSLGRWFWLYLDRLRFGISTEPITSLLALACYSTGIIISLDIFDIKVTDKIVYLVSMLFLSSVSVSISLSFRFMSVDFGVAFLLAMLAAWAIIKIDKVWLAVIAGGILIALSTGVYQAYIGCTCITLVGYFLIVLCDDRVELKTIVRDIIKSVLAAALGGILYFIILKLHLTVFHIGLSDYNGANNYSLMNAVKNLPFSIGYSYRVFILYFFENNFKLNVLQEFKIYWIVFLGAAIFFIRKLLGIAKKNKIKALLFALFIATVPIASNAVLLITTGVWVSLHMTVAMALCIPIILCAEVQDCTGKIWSWVWKINVLVLLIMLYGNIYQLQIDQEAMWEGQKATISIAEEIIHKLDETGNLDANVQYCVLGSPAGNELFYFSKIAEEANRYALFGNWNTGMRRSWQGVFRYLCGINLEMCSSWDYDAIAANPRVENMPVFPEEGCIIKIDNIVVVKVSP